MLCDKAMDTCQATSCEVLTGPCRAHTHTHIRLHARTNKHLGLEWQVFQMTMLVGLDFHFEDC